MQRQRLNSRWLVTGGCGFIGANLVQRLCQTEIPLRVLDDCSVGQFDPPDGVEFIREDIRDAAAVRGAVEGVDVVIHLAAQSGVMPSIKDPGKDFEVNTVGTLNMLTACRDAAVRRLVFASSNAALGEVPVPFEEAQAPHPISPYGASKLAGEAYCLAFTGSYGLETVALRFANVYGPRSSHKNSVVAKFLKQALDGQPLIIFGDGSQTRDLIYVDDLCDAIILAAQADCSGEVFQIASGVETKIIDLAQLIVDMIGPRSRIAFEERRRGEPHRIVASIEKARRMLGFSAKVELEEGVRRTYKWFVSHYPRAEAIGDKAIQ